jgi:hypothetical protein
MGTPPGIDTAAEVLTRLGTDADAVDAWVRRTRVRAADAAESGLAA